MFYNSSFTKDALVCRGFRVYKSKSLINSNLILQLLNKNKASGSICKNYFTCKVAFTSKNHSRTVITFCSTKNAICTNCFPCYQYQMNRFYLCLLKSDKIYHF